MVLRTMLVAVLFSYLQLDCERLDIVGSVACRLALVAVVCVSKDVQLC